MRFFDSAFFKNLFPQALYLVPEGFSNLASKTGKYSRLSVDSPLLPRAEC
jgi:hypothetical protein